MSAGHGTGQEAWYEIIPSLCNAGKYMTLILVIEDDAIVRANILELLEAEEFEVIGAPNGRQGVQLASLHLPDLIICDVMMPELDGYGVLKALRASPETARIPFIFLTAKAERLDWRQGRELGADDYLTKPCTPDELLDAISTRLEKQKTAVAHYTTAIQQAESQLHRLIYYDRLTNLPNRLSLRDQFDRIEDRKEKIAVMVLGLDRFNRINQSLGHAWGDELLKAVVQRLRTCLSSQDVVVRLGADRFAIIRVGDRLAQAEMAQALLLCINRPFTLEGREIFLTASIGIGGDRSDGEDLEKFLQGARRALGKAQQQGGNQYQFYTPDMDRDSTETLALETSLRYAIAREELQVHYQPKVNLKDGRIVGAEALLRWQHPERGLVSPAKFIPIAIVSKATMVQKTLKSWQKLGIKIAMDDFGTGYSGFNYLQVLPFDILKIDRSFFQNITGQDDRNISLVKTIIQMAHKLQMQVIAEGVERSAELDLLWKYDCDEIQGYLFSPPLPGEAFQKLILSGKILSINDVEKNKEK